MALGSDRGDIGVDVAHADDMDRMYRYQRHIYDATRKYYLLGRDRMIRQLDARPGCHILEAACGTGRNLSQISRLYPSTHLYGFDISAEMLVSARKKFPASGPVVPQFRVADATTFTPADFGVAGFDRIILSYALSMIPDWEAAIGQAAAALAPGGSLHIVDFGQQEGLPAICHRLLGAWLAKFHVTPRATLKTALQAAAARHGATLRFETVARGYAWHAVLTVPAAP